MFIPVQTNFMARSRDSPNDIRMLFDHPTHYEKDRAGLLPR
jgi:hypothetical protein